MIPPKNRPTRIAFPPKTAAGNKKLITITKKISTRPTLPSSPQPMKKQKNAKDPIIINRGNIITGIYAFFSIYTKHIFEILQLMLLFFGAPIFCGSRYGVGQCKS